MNVFSALDMNPTLMFFRPLERCISKFSDMPTFGRKNDVDVFFIALSNPFGVLLSGSFVPCAIFIDQVIPGVIVTCEYLATAEPAGFIVTAPGSPPSAVKAFPIAMVRAVPS